LLSQLAEVSSRGPSVFEEVETKLQKMWKDHSDAQLEKPLEEVKVYKKSSKAQDIKDDEEELAKAKKELAKRTARKRAFKTNI